MSMDKCEMISMKASELEKKVRIPDFQRYYTSQARIKAMAANFNPAALGIIICYDNPNSATDEWDIVDGMHRIRAAAQAKFRGDLDVKLFHHPRGRSPEECESIGAKLFCACNDKMNMGALDFFNAQVKAGDERAVEIITAIHESGFRVPRKGSSYWPKEGDPYLSQVRFLYRSDLDVEGLINCLTCLKNAAIKFSDQMQLRKTFLRTEFVYGFVGLWEKVGEQIESKIMIKALIREGNSPSDLINKIAANAATRGQVPPRPGHSFPAMERMIAVAYNRQRSTNFSKIDLELV